ncbi:MAG: hypothetical protein IPH88_09095 [Bacteroidales bacterium]|nr:hypothetical protein [Bacteroidales bacterium]
MKTINSKATLAILLLLLTSGSLFAQQKRNIGLSATIQGNQYGIMMPVWVSSKVAIVPVVELVSASKIGTDLGIGVSPRYYFKTDKLCPYLGVKLGTVLNFPSSKNQVDDKTKVDLIGGLNFGAEYFIAEKLSLGIEAQGNFTKSDKNSNRFGNPDGINFNTGTMLVATIYF